MVGTPGMGSLRSEREDEKAMSDGIFFPKLSEGLVLI